jgi:hypothetical protein
VLVLDRSNSMRDRTRTGTKWSDLTGAVNTVLDRHSEVAWGLSLFPVSDRNSCVVAPLSVLPEVGTAPVIASLIRNAQPTGAGTPTRAALEEAGREVMAAGRPSRKYLLLATDGDPNCLEGARDTNAPDVEGTTALIRWLAENDVTTFVLGVAVRSSSEAALRAMAQAGGHAREGMTAYYTANDADELEIALDEVARQIALCTFELSPPPPAGADVTVSIGGRVFPRNPRHAGDGWDVTSGGKAIALYGAACDAVQAGGEIQARYGCGSGTRCDLESMACVPLAGGEEVEPPMPDAGAPMPDAGAPVADAGAAPDARPPSHCVSGCGVDRRCRYDAQCGPGGRCEGGQCRRPCAATADCGTGERCTEGLCRPAEACCAVSSDCKAEEVCVNGSCYATCSKPGDCTNPRDLCDRGLCRPDTGRVATCRAKADCPANMDCVDGLCRTPCCLPADCASAPSGPVCWTGYCFKQNEAEPACFLNADCGAGKVCADATCR